jgi:hypothetical protein
MDFTLDRIENKIELLEARDMAALERRIAEQIDMNKALLLDVHSVSHQVVFDPNREAMLYTAIIHFKAKTK